MKPNDRITSLIYIISALALGALLGLLIRSGLSAYQAQKPPKPYQPVAVTSTNSNLQHPLSIAALGSRTYGGGLLKTERTLPNRTSSTARVVSYPSDSLKINALMLTPTKPQPAGGYPVVILAHGFLPGDVYKTESEEYLAWADALTAEGYVVIKPDYRGHDQSWGAQESAYYSSGYTHDILNLAANVQRQPTVNPKKIAVLGHSLGGHIAFKAMTAKPDLIKAVALAAGSTTTASEIYSLGFPSESNGSVSSSAKEALVRTYGVPSEDSPFWRSTSPLYSLNDLRGGVWLAHCKDDTNVPKALTDQVATKLKVANKEFSYFECETGGHAFGGSVDADFTASLKGFFRQQFK